MNTIPFLSNAFLNAYNARRANFLGAQIFDFTFNHGNKIRYNGADYDVPDQLTIAAISKLIQNQNTMSLKNENDYDEKFSAEIKGDYTGVFFSGSAYSNLSFRGSLFTSTEVEYFVNTLVYQTYTAQRNVHTGCLDSTFQQALNSLPSTMEGNFQAFIDFFDEYGTHFLYNGNFGATIFMQTSAEKSLLKKLSEQEIEAGITAGFNGAVTSGSVSASAVYKSSSVMSQNQSSFSLYFESLGGSLTQDIKQFEASVPDQPVLLLTSYGSLGPAQFTPISQLCTDTNKQVLINEAIKSYMLLAQEEDGLISIPTLLTADVSKNAASDGMILATLYETAGPVQDLAVSNAADKTATASVHYSSSIKAYIPAAVSLLPVREKDAYSYSNTGKTAKANFLSVSELNNPVFGTWQTVTAGNVNQAASNGFLLISLSQAASGASGSATLATGNTSSQLSTVGGPSVFVNTSSLQVPANSFCYPLLKGQYYQVTQSFSGTITSEYLFIPVNEIISSLSTPTPRNAGTVYTANRDGFLVASLAASDGSFGTLCAAVNTDGGDTATPTIKAGASVFNEKNSLGISLPQNAICVPVSAGSTYRVFLDASLPKNGSPVISVQWFEFFPSAEQYDLNSIHEQQERLASLSLVV